VAVEARQITPPAYVRGLGENAQQRLAEPLAGVFAASSSADSTTAAVSAIMSGPALPTLSFDRL